MLETFSIKLERACWMVMAISIFGTVTYTFCVITGAVH